MSKTAGNFTETARQNIRVLAEQMLMDNRIKLQFTPTSLETMNAIQSVQTANIEQLLGNPAKEDKVGIEFINNCEIIITNTTNCIPSAPKLSSALSEYSLTKSKEVAFTVSENDLRANDINFEDVVAKGFLTADKLLSEQVQQDAIAVLNAGKGFNARTGGKGTVTGNDTYIATNNWTADLYSYFLSVMAKNRFNGGVFLTGHESLFEAYTQAMFNAGNADGKGALASFRGVPTFFDIFNIEIANTPDEGDTPNISYLLSTGSVAFASKPIYQTTVEEASYMQRFAMKSNFISNLWLNVLTFTECDNNFFKRTFKVMAKYDTFINPTGCNDDNTGVLTFICGTPDVS